MYEIIDIQYIKSHPLRMAFLFGNDFKVAKKEFKIVAKKYHSIPHLEHVTMWLIPAMINSFIYNHYKKKTH